LTDNLGATVLEVNVDELRENTFYAKIILELSGLTQEIDARPSDAIALAVRAQAPIYVAETIWNLQDFCHRMKPKKLNFPVFILNLKKVKRNRKRKKPG
jgi:bifunctional DNase/RNase